MYARRPLTPIGALALMLLFGLLAIGNALATPEQERIGGTMEAVIGGKKINFPSLSSDVSAKIEGDLAMVTVVQTFVNPSDQPMNATYLFPLNKDAAVHFMQMQMGTNRVTAVIKERQEARVTYERAKQAGKVAALLNQHRPNMFTQELANLMPGVPVKVTLKYAQSVPRIDGAYELVVPLVVGPRFTPRQHAPQTVSQEETPPVKPGQWNFAKPPSLPDVSGLTIPDEVERDRVSIAVDLVSSLPINGVKSATHAIAVTGGDKRKALALSNGRTIDNKDFVLRYKLAGEKTGAGLLAHKDQRGAFFSLLLEPPEAPLAQDVTPREMVFVLDTSGSMTGLPIEASKTFMRHALKSLRASDYFRVIRFSDTASEFTSKPIPATMINKLAGIRFVNSLRAGGGTQIPQAIDRSFSVPVMPGALRIVTFLSDGYIGNEAEVLNRIAGQIGNARIYTFGIGTAVNRFLIAEMARKGRGFARFIDPTENSHEAAIDLAQRLEAPVLTDITVDWGGLAPQSVTPELLPDLFKGDSLRLMAKAGADLQPGSTHEVIVRGRVNGRAAILPLKVAIPQNLADPKASSLPLIWARQKIKDHMRVLTTPRRLRHGTPSNEAIKQKVTKLGLDYSLMTQWTSFVAVLDKVVNVAPRNNVDANVPQHQVKGVSEKAYDLKKKRLQHIRLAPLQKAQASPQGLQRHASARHSFAGHGTAVTGGAMNHMFGGSSTPEPGETLAMILLAALMLALLWRMKRAA